MLPLALMDSVSLIIPTRNRASFLSELLDLYMPWLGSSFVEELIVVDNASSDETQRFCRERATRHKKFRYVRVEKLGLLHCRNRAVDISSGDILSFIEDDTLPFQSWLDGLESAFTVHGAELAGGNVLPLWEIDPPDWLESWWSERDGIRSLGYLSLIDMGPVIRQVSPLKIYGCNFSIRRSLLLEAGGFHPDTYPADLDRWRGDGETGLAMAVAGLGKTALHHPLLSVYHRVASERMTEEYFCRRAYLQGISDSYSEVRKFGGITDPLRMKVRDAYKQGVINHRRALLEDPDLLKWVLKQNYWPSEEEDS